MRSELNTDTICALMCAKQIQDVPCFDFKPSDELLKQGWAVNTAPGIYRWYLPVNTVPANTPQVANTGKYWSIELFQLKNNQFIRLIALN